MLVCQGSLCDWLQCINIHGHSKFSSGLREARITTESQHSCRFGAGWELQTSRWQVWQDRATHVLDAKLTQRCFKVSVHMSCAYSGAPSFGQSSRSPRNLRSSASCGPGITGDRHQFSLLEYDWSSTPTGTLSTFVPRESFGVSWAWPALDRPWNRKCVPARVMSRGVNESRQVALVKSATCQQRYFLAC